MGVKVVTASAIGLLALVTACSGGTTTGSPAATATGPATSSSVESGPAGTSAGGDCPVGTYEVTTITGKSGTQVNGVPVVAKSGGGFTLALTADGTWTLSGDNAEVTLSAADVSAQATVNGTAEGEYAKIGSQYTFRQQSASGRVTLKQPIAGVSGWSMTEVGPALAPGGTATLECGVGTLRITSESVVLDLKSTGGAAGPGPAGPTSQASSGGGGPLTISDSAQTRTIDCAGRDVALNGSSNKLTFTGSCGSVSVNGSRNELTLATVAQISVNGSFNKVTWSSGNPKTFNNGTGNTISQG